MSVVMCHIQQLVARITLESKSKIDQTSARMSDLLTQTSDLLTQTAFLTLIFKPTPPLLDWARNPNSNVVGAAELWHYKSKDSHMCIKCQKNYSQTSIKATY